MSENELAVTISSKEIRIKATDPITLDWAYREIREINILKNYSSIFSEVLLFKRTGTEIRIEAIANGSKMLWHACYFSFLSKAEYLRQQYKPFTPPDLNMCVWSVANRVLTQNEALRYLHDTR